MNLIIAVLFDHYSFPVRRRREGTEGTHNFKYQMLLLFEKNESVYLFWFLRQCVPLVDLCGAWTPVDLERPKHTPFLFRQRDWGTGLCLSIYGLGTIGFSSESVNLFDHIEEIITNIICADGRTVIQALYFCPQKVWICKSITGP